MPAPVVIPARNTAAEYAGVLRKLLPRGRVWTRDDDGTQAAVLDALGVTAEGIDSAALTLIAAGFPASADQLLPEWDATLGLPDPCFGPFASDDENRQQTVAKLISTGGQTVAYFIALAASLGYTITITEYFAHTVTRDVTVPVYGMDWPYTWLVNVTGAPPPHWHEVSDPVDDPLSSYISTPNGKALECLLRRYAPAHTVVCFCYNPITDIGP
ncbi:YmfQ family protein [Paraburkholderia adhaesiva]|uniref:YmfQ family protein n=1 Tax=Paraburkholderia adhaesiva TaxID=2883244 RepID=UPI001F4020D9|nr:putative phage tail protein [Paraburkholderia adhaesiva]